MIRPQLLLLCLALSLLIACDSEDDVNAIFVGRTWHITSVTVDGETLNGDDIKELYTYSSSYYITFAGSTFTGALVAGSSIAGRWTADGSNHTFSLSFTTANQVNASTVSAYVYDILRNASAYAGDQNTLRIKQDNANYILLSSSSTTL